MSGNPTTRPIASEDGRSYPFADITHDELNGRAALAVQYGGMRYFAPATPLVLRSDFSPDECERRLRESIDLEQPTMFGFSGYQGSKPFLGEVDGKQFRVLQRIYSSRNTLPTVIIG